MRENLVGILESRDDRFINDVIYRLNGVHTEFLSLSAEKVPIEREYRVVVDRLSFSYPFLKEVVKSLSLSGTYIINNPFTSSATNKILDMKLGSGLSLTFPKTIVLPDHTVIEEMGGLVAPPDLCRVVEELGFPCVLKPFNGYAWENVYFVKSAEELRNLYNSMCSRHVLLAQQFIKYQSYFRVFCFDRRDVLFARWIPKPLSMGQYISCDPNCVGEARDELTAQTVRLNQSLDLDVNVVEWCLDEKGQWWVIDAYNEVPEIIRESLPPECYDWLVDRFAACIIDKVNSDKKNRTPFQ